MYKVLIISDPHLYTSGLYGRDTYERLHRCFAHMRAHHADASFILLLGDIAHNGDAATYTRLASLARELPLPLFALPGNHDDAGLMARMLPPFSGAAAEASAGLFVGGQVTLGEAVFLFVDTSRAGQAGGGFSQADANRLHSCLTGERDVFLCMHHPPLRCGVPYMDAIALSEDTPLLRLLAEAPPQRLRMMLCGHVHRSVCGLWHGVPVVITRGLSGEVSLPAPGAQCGAAIPGRDSPAAYTVLLFDANGPVAHEERFEDMGPPVRL